jgi:hypothetical protein
MKKNSKSKCSLIAGGYMNKDRIIKRIKENFEDMENALVENCAFDYIPLFDDYTDEIIKIIEEECTE